MRLFIAVLFDKESFETIWQAEEMLRLQAVAGNFTRKENLHMTLVFLGETTNAEGAKCAMDAVEAEPFPLTLHGAGMFSHGDNDIYWLAVEHEPRLIALQSQLCKTLREEGFVLEDRTFQPHVTLGKRVRVKEDFVMQDYINAIPPILARVDKISLMKSEWVHGVLTYTEIGVKKLGLVQGE